MLLQPLKSLKIAVIGQSKFGADVYKLLKKQGHEIVAVFTIPDKDGRQDLLGESTFMNIQFYLQTELFNVNSSMHLLCVAGVRFRSSY